MTGEDAGFIAEGYDNTNANEISTGYEMITRSTPANHSPNAGLGGAADRRHAAVVAAETRKLERCLNAIGPMPRKRLAEIARSREWRDGTFEEAVRRGIRLHELRELPLGWLASTRR